MDPFTFLQEECESVRSALKETLRHDYGPKRSLDYYRECEDRLAFIQEAIDREPGMGAEKIADNMRDLARIGIRVALIERSHLGEFSWPFTDIIREFAEKLFLEEELYGGGPIVHVVSEGTGYQVVDDPASRPGTRRILIVAFPRQLKHHVLIHAIFGHELGHPAARTDDSGRIAQTVLEACEVGALQSAKTARDWLTRNDAPAVVKAEQRRQGEYTPSNEELKDWRTEIFCDLFGLHLFGPAFAVAHRAALEPASGWPSKIDLGSATHPPYAVRRRVIAAAMRLKRWHIPCTSEADGAVYIAENAMLSYAAEDGGDPWLTVLADGDLDKILLEIDKVFLPHAEIAYSPPDRLLTTQLIDRLILGRPPIADHLEESGKTTYEPVPIQHCLYAGWTAWFGREKLRLTKLTKHPRLKVLTFLEINRLCEQALLQQRAINTVTEWKARHPPKTNGEEEEPPPPPRVNGPKSGTLGRSKLISRIRSEELSVAPLLSPEQIGASSIDLRMGNVVLIVRARGSSHVDPARAMKHATGESHEKEAGLQQKHERYELKFETSFLLHPGTLALVPTLEWVSLPSDLMGHVTARSTWAREGLSIATATMIEPGYQGIVTLELANLGEIPIALYPGLELAQISFTDVVGDTTRPKKGQFGLSFEPRQGVLAKESEYPFLPAG